jgi:hypothetical protein
MGTVPKPPSPQVQAWVEARERYHLSHARVQMARELGLSPRKLGKIANRRQEPGERRCLNSSSTSTSGGSAGSGPRSSRRRGNGPGSAAAEKGTRNVAVTNACGERWVRRLPDGT